MNLPSLQVYLYAFIQHLVQETLISLAQVEIYSFFVRELTISYIIHYKLSYIMLFYLISSLKSLSVVYAFTLFFPQM